MYIGAHKVPKLNQRVPTSAIKVKFDHRLSFHPYRPQVDEHYSRKYFKIFKDPWPLLGIRDQCLETTYIFFSKVILFFYI